MEALRPWARYSFALQPCVRDLRGEHVLFEASQITGIIDFGALAVDHPAGDLARLLNDFSASDTTLFSAGLKSYRAGGILAVPEEFVHLLTDSGTVCSVIGWLIRLTVRRDPVSEIAKTASRLEQLVACIEQFRHI